MCKKFLELYSIVTDIKLFAEKTLYMEVTPNRNMYFITINSSPLHNLIIRYCGITEECHILVENLRKPLLSGCYEIDTIFETTAETINKDIERFIKEHQQD